MQMPMKAQQDSNPLKSTHRNGGKGNSHHNNSISGKSNHELCFCLLREREGRPPKFVLLSNRNTVYNMQTL